jgi:hypothetical protein
MSPQKGKPPHEKIADVKHGKKNVEGGSGSSKEKTAVAGTDDSNPYSCEGTIDGLLEVGGLGGTCSLEKEKKEAKTTSDEAVATAGEEALMKVRCKDRKIACRASIPERKKLIVFNVYGTLLDCSLLQDPNPNTAIRLTFRTMKRRVIFRPGLIDFMNRCFIHFEVAFWSSKSEAYMDDIVPTILGRLKDWKTFTPLFVWSGKECDVTKWNDGMPVEWEKPLRKVYKCFPHFSEANTVIIDQ